MYTKILASFRLLAVAIAISVSFIACNQNAKTEITTVVDSSKIIKNDSLNMKKSKRVIDTTAEPRPLLPGG